jgi:hypothetical protein
MKLEGWVGGSWMEEGEEKRERKKSEAQAATGPASLHKTSLTGEGDYL